MKTWILGKSQIFSRAFGLQLACRTAVTYFSKRNPELVLLDHEKLISGTKNIFFIKLAGESAPASALGV